MTFAVFLFVSSFVACVMGFIVGFLAGQLKEIREQQFRERVKGGLG